MEIFDSNTTINKLVPTTLNLKLAPPYFSRSYGVLLTFSNQPEAIAIKYELEITYLKTIEDNKRLFKIDRTSEVYINDLPPEQVADQLAYEVGKVFYPLVIEVGFDGAYQAVHNHQEIQQRWKIVKENVLDYFSGEEVNEYLSQTEQIIKDSFSLDMCFRNDFFVNTFFSPIYQNYGEERTMLTERAFNLVANVMPIDMEIRSQLAAETNHYGAVEIEQQGEEVLYEENPWFNATYKASFVLDARTKSIESLLANYQWDDGSENEVDIRIFRIDEGQTFKETAVNGASNLVFLDPVVKKEKKGFFKNLF